MGNGTADPGEQKRQVKGQRHQDPGDKVARLDAPLVFGAKQKPEQVVLFGDHPLAVNPQGEPYNLSGCFFHPDGKLIDRPYLLMCHPHHNAGAMAFAYYLTYKDGKGIDIPQVGIKADQMPQPKRFLDLAYELMGGSKLIPKEISGQLNQVASDYYMEAQASYVPIVISGGGSSVEVGVRKDGSTKLELIDKTIVDIRETLRVPDRQIMGVSDTQTDSEKLRRHFEQKGELWRLYPPSGTGEDQQKLVDSRHRESPHGLKIFYAIGTGERFLTCDDLRQFAEGFREGRVLRESVGSQLKELVMMATSTNRAKRKNLSLLGVEESEPFIDALKRVSEVANEETEPGRLKNPDSQVANLLGDAVAAFEGAASDAYKTNSYDDPKWVNRMYKLLMGLRKVGSLEEVAIGLSREYIGGQLQWLRGATVVSDPSGGWRMAVHPEAETHPTAMILDYERYFRSKDQKLSHINIALDRMSHSKRGKMHPDEEREVYIVEYRLEGDEKNRVDLIRRQKWDELHYRMGLEFKHPGGELEFVSRQELERGREAGRFKDDKEGTYMEVGGQKVYGERLSHNIALSLTEEYTRYCLQRNELERRLFPDHPIEVQTINIVERSPELGEYMRKLHIRTYMRGVAADKINPEKLANPEFTLSVSAQMGKAAARNLALGRVNPLTGEHIFGDGDEILQFDKPRTDPDTKAVGVVLSDMSSVLGDVDKDPGEYPPVYARWLGRFLKTAADAGLAQDDLRSCSDAFIESFSSEIEQTKQRIDPVTGAEKDIHKLFEDNLETIGEKRYLWQGCRTKAPKIIARLRNADPDALAGVLRHDDSLKWIYEG